MANEIPVFQLYPICKSTTKCFTVSFLAFGYESHGNCYHGADLPPMWHVRDGDFRQKQRRSAEVHVYSL